MISKVSTFYCPLTATSSTAYHANPVATVGPDRLTGHGHSEHDAGSQLEQQCQRMHRTHRLHPLLYTNTRQKKNK